MGSVMPLRLWLLVGLFLCATASGAPEGGGTAPRSATFTHRAMNTDFVFTMYARPGDTHVGELEGIAEEAFRAIDDLEDRLSSWKPGSQIAYVNRHAAESPAQVSVEVMEVVRQAARFYRETGGAFDITVGPLLELWGFYDKIGRIPSDSEIGEALSRVGMDKVSIDAKEGTIAFSRAGVRLDFGGIGKGVALDLAAGILKGYGITAALLHGGTSTVVAIGAPPGTGHWTVHVQNPYNEVEHLDTLFLADASLSTSGCYGHMLEADGARYCHIIDPRTGRPVDGVLSVSVIAASGVESDALSTGFLVWGRGQIEEYCRRNKAIGAVFVAVPEDGKPEAVRINVVNERKEP